jgi:mycofactocin precursor
MTDPIITPRYTSDTDEDSQAPDSSGIPTEADAELVEADLLVEDVSIDGMCGVY